MVFYIEKQPLGGFKYDMQDEHGKPVRATTHGDLNPELARSLRRRFRKEQEREQESDSIRSLIAKL